MCIKRQGSVERQGRAKRMRGGDEATTSWTRGMGGHGATIGDGAMRGRDSGIWEVGA